ncbi:MAG: lysophospholipid acyltransferase family protein [Steroidobacteraceae bacterium]
MQLLRSILYTSWLFLGTLLYALVLLCICWLPLRYLQALARSWARSQLRMLKVLCGLDYRVTGQEHIPAGAHVALCKHSSAWETVAQTVILPPQAWVLKRELTWIPFVGWAMRRLKPIAINRSAGASAVHQVVKQGQDRLREGLWVVVFPEGTRVAPGESRKYGVSGALLATKAGCKVLPVAHDAGRYWPRRGWLKKRGTIQVVIGPPIDASGQDPRVVTERAREWIESTLARNTGAGLGALSAETA